MARKESIALGGYFATPTHLLPRIAHLVEADEDEKYAFLDPCIGEGEAICTLMEILGQSTEILYSCEMETKRYAAAKKRLEAISWSLGKSISYGDAFRVSFKATKGVSMLYLNPPYDTDRVHGRLEQKFLDRFAPALMHNGVLLFVVPFYALKASAELLGREFTGIRCYRFPEADFEYKQVVLYARKGVTLHTPRTDIVEQIEAWSQDVSGLPELPTENDPNLGRLPPVEGYSGALDWKMHPVDTTALLKKVQPWKQTARGGQLIPALGVIPDTPVQEMLLRTYPVATPPRPAHIAAGIASGLFNGSHIVPSDPNSGFPALLVKGAFDREYRTVEEKMKKNDDGKEFLSSVIQVQQPKLVTTILDLSTHQYHVLKPNSEETDTTDVSEMTVADLLKHYGDSLMKVMERQCPIFYDPRKDSDSISLAETPRKLFTAQQHASKALVKLLGGQNASKTARKGKAAILLGEIGSGKSTVALATTHTIGAKRVLVLCPPHLLDSWTNEIAAVLPDADVRVLTSIADIEALEKLKGNNTVIGLLSRETAKLDHGWEGVGSCPKCGHNSAATVTAQAKRRMRCGHQTMFAGDPLASFCMDIANKLVRHTPTAPAVEQILCEGFGLTRRKHYEALIKPGNATPDFPSLWGGLYISPTVWARIEQDDPLQTLHIPNPKLAWAPKVLDLLIDKNRNGVTDKAIIRLLLALGDDQLIADTARSMLEADLPSGRSLLLMLPPNGELQREVVAEFTPKRRIWDPWNSFTKEVESVLDGSAHQNYGITWEEGRLQIKGVNKKHEVGTLDSACTALILMSEAADFRFTDPCQEFMYQAVPSPRRTSLAKYITHRHPDLFDFLILDEGHEYASEGSAQSVSAHRLTGLKLPTILMTGTIMNGYAASLFTNLWALSPTFREEFNRDDKQRFIDRYGYRKIEVYERNIDSGEIVEFGSMSDRVERAERVVGNAPGVLPLFLLRHLLRFSVTLHKSDLKVDLPELHQELHLIEADKDLKAKYKVLQEGLVAQIRRDIFTDKSGRLFGQLAELPSFLDRASNTTGNTPEGAYSIRYPESVGGELVVENPHHEQFAATHHLPKEEWMLARVERELAEGRNVMVFAWHTNLLTRYVDLIEERLGEKVALLQANKVSTKKRQGWINKEVIGKKRRVLVTNPVAIQTGLNNLVHFATEIWMENPACNPIIFRQAVGRVDRIGQTLETRIHVPVYQGTLQEQMYDLLMQKVAVSVSTDGLDPESALQAAGVGEDEYLAGLSIGKQLWSLLTDEKPSKARRPRQKALERPGTPLDEVLSGPNRAALQGLCEPSESV